jgi:hypothetical protein
MLSSKLQVGLEATHINIGRAENPLFVFHCIGQLRVEDCKRNLYGHGGWRLLFNNQQHALHWGLCTRNQWTDCLCRASPS